MLAKMGEREYFIFGFEAKPMKSTLSSMGNLYSKFMECLRDERGTAMTEYLIVTAIMVPLAAYLFDPDNGFYQDFRNQYNLTTTLLMWVGP